jgi:hypothetical protein
MGANAPDLLAHKDIDGGLIGGEVNPGARPPSVAMN